MTRPRFGLLLVFTSFQLSCLSFTPPVPLNERLETQEVAPGIYAVVGAQGNANAGFILTRQGVVVVDSQISPRTAGMMVAAIRKITQLPILYLINTHAHGDHVFANHMIQPTKGIIAHRRAKTFLINRGEEMLAQYDRFVGQEAARGAQVTPPTMTIRAQATLPFRDRTIILAHIGKGHTDGDIVVWLPEDRVLFTGDLVYNRRLPWLGGGSVLEWLTTLKRLKEFPFTWVVPGHGPVGTRQTVERFERYLTSLRKEVIEAFLHEEPLDTLKQRLRLPSYKEDIKYEEWLPLNIEQVYRQMEQEKFSN